MSLLMSMFTVMFMQHENEREYEHKLKHERHMNMSMNMNLYTVQGRYRDKHTNIYMDIFANM
jgi:hypothetical protein